MSMIKHLLICMLLAVFWEHTLQSGCAPKYLWGEKCGIGTIGGVQRQRRVVDGVNVVHGEMPWMVAVEDTTDSYCAAALLNSRWAITSCSCINYGQWYYVNAITGQIYRNTDTQSQSHTIEKKITHPLCDIKRGQLADYDVGLLKLTPPADVKLDNVGSICLPHKNFDFTDEQWKCWVAGWGAPNLAAVEHSWDSAWLLKAQLTVADCMEPAYTGTKNIHICAWNETNPTQGPSDRGAGYAGELGCPLMCRKGNDPVVLAGVYQGEEGHSEGKPFQFAKVQNEAILKWIKDIIKEK